MIIFFKKDRILRTFDPVVLVDYTRSDDQWSRAKIQEQVLKCGALLQLSLPGVNFSSIVSEVFSLDYSVSYRHSAVNIADSLKTYCEITVSNAPSKLASLVSLNQIFGQESVMSLENAVSKVADAKVEFPFGFLVFETPGAPVPMTIVRQLIVYSTNFNFDQKRINSTLKLKGAAFDSMVVRLAFSMNITKEAPLASQVAAELAKFGWVTAPDRNISAVLPVVARYYPPAPIANVLTELCRDNGLWFDIDREKGVVTLKSLQSFSVPPPQLMPVQLSFRSTVPLTYLISTFSVQDYAGLQYKTELFDVSLFDTHFIFNDSGAADLFENFRPSPLTSPNPRGGLPLLSYSAYVLEYEMIINSHETALRIKATNNWLLSNIRLDTLFENAVYLASGQ